MPEITEAQASEYRAYTQLGTPEQVSKKIGDLEKDNHKQRGEIQTLKDAKKVLEEKAAPEGAVVLTGDDAAKWTRYQALGTPDEVESAAKERDALRTTVKGREWEDAVKTAAEAEGWGKPAILRLALKGLEDHTLEVREDKGDKGEKVRVAYIKEPGEGKAAKKLRDYLTEREPDVLETLAGSSGSGAGGAGGVPYVPSRAGAGDPPAPGKDSDPVAVNRASGRYAI